MSDEDLARIVARVDDQDWRFRMIDRAGKPHLPQTEFETTDAATGKPYPARKRKCHISRHATESEVVLKCLKAVFKAEEHEASEPFRYRVRRSQIRMWLSTRCVICRARRG